MIPDLETWRRDEEERDGKGSLLEQYISLAQAKGAPYEAPEENHPDQVDPSALFDGEGRLPAEPAVEVKGDVVFPGREIVIELRVGLKQIVDRKNMCQ